MTEAPTVLGNAGRKEGSAAWLVRAWRSTARTRFLLLLFLALGLVWQAACRIFAIRPFLFPAPTDVLAKIVADPLFLLNHMAYTTLSVLCGFGLAVVVGVGIAILVAYSPFLERTLFTLLVAFNAIPKVAIAPLFVLWVGTEIESKILIAFLIALFPMVVDTVQGLKSIDPALLDLARAYRGSMGQVFWKIRLRQALPSIFAGMKVAISLALIGTIVGEFVGANRGLGYVIMQAQGTYQTSLVFAALLLLGVLGTILFNLVDVAERFALPWHVAHRSEADGRS